MLFLAAVSLLCLGIVGGIPVGGDGCVYSLTESIPNHVDIKTPLTTADAWLNLINNAKKTIDIASFYWTLTGGDAVFGGDQGQKVYDAIKSAGERGIKIRVVQTAPSSSFSDDDSFALEKLGLIELRSLNMTQLFQGGIVHTKFMVFDSDAMWVGSANMDWRSLTQVKELGIQVQQCEALASDLDKVFEIYWEAADMQALPAVWPSTLDTAFNVVHPADISMNDAPGKAFIASSPRGFCTAGRTADDDAIVHAISNANASVSIEVMDYAPTTVFYRPNFYWPVIDSALRSASFSGVNVRLLIGNWTHSDRRMFDFLKSLSDITRTGKGSLSVKLYNVPPDPAGVVDFARVNHAKFMVTDKVAYIGTSNWQADYFLDTAGVSFNCEQDECVSRLQDVFDRDWNSQYAVDL